MRARQVQSCDIQRCQHDDEQRPQVVDQVHFDAWGQPQADEQQEVKAKQREHAKRQRAVRNLPQAFVPDDKRNRQQAADHQRDASQQKRRQVLQRHAECGECGPQSDRAQRVQIGLHAGEHSGRMRKERRTEARWKRNVWRSTSLVMRRSGPYSERAQVAVGTTDGVNHRYDAVQII